MAKEKNTGMGGKSFLKGEVNKKSAVQAFASKKEDEKPKNPRKTFSSQMLPELKQELKIKAAALGVKEYVVIEDALREYFLKKG